MSDLRNECQNFLDGLEAVEDGNGLSSVASLLARRLGFRWFAYLGSAEPEVTILSSYPKAWISRYRTAHFEKIDPVVKPRWWPDRAFLWSGKACGWTPEQRSFFNEAEAFQIRWGVTVPIRGGGASFAALTFASDTSGEELWNSQTALETLQLMGLYFHAHVYAKLRLGVGRPENSPLTPRETQCLVWVARGKTMAETAEILGITKRTIEFHLDNARAKLNAVKVSQAVAEAVRRNLLPRT